MRWVAAAVVTGVFVVPFVVLVQTPRAQGQTQAVALKAREFAFDPREITVRAGEVTIVLTNEGGIEHALVVQDDSRATIAEIISVLPEKSEQVRVALTAGSYTFYCPVGSGIHRRRGMVGQLTVTQ